MRNLVPSKVRRTKQRRMRGRPRNKKKGRKIQRMKN